MARGSGSARSRRRRSSTTARPASIRGTNRSGSADRIQFADVCQK